MKTRIFRHAGVALASTLVLSSLALTPIGVPVDAQATPVTVKIDTSSKTSVQNAYLNVYLKNVDVANGWTGNLNNCTAGTDSADATVNMVNYYRALAGLPSVKENAQATKNAQQAALVMAANGNLSHYPPDSWTCMSTTAYTAAGVSNLGLGYSTTGRTVEGWMSDNGTPSVGHRNAILYPPLGQVGTGIAGTGTPLINGYPSLGYALEWMDSSLWTNKRTGNDVEWPSAGYFPSQNLPSSGYWSFSHQNTNFNGGTGQTVTVTKKAADGTTTTIPVTGVSSSQDGSGWVPDSVLVWTMPQIAQPGRGQVDTYTVTISGAVNTTYDVKVFTAVDPCSFTDVPKTNTFYPAICWAATTGITKGTGDGSTYSPTNPVNRGSMAAFLYRLAGSPKWDAPKVSPFADVPTTHGFYAPITWLYAQGVTVGVTIDGKMYYQPNNAVNRGSMAAFMYRIANRPKWDAPSASPFTDINQANQFYPSVTWLANAKITVGSTVNGKLVYQPSNPVNRGSMAAFMNRLAKTQLMCTKYQTAIGC